MSELSGVPDPRRRADARRSRATIIEAAITLLGRRADASMAEIAAAAGVTRQTVYAHYRSRDLLLRAVVDRITAETTAALDAVDPAAGTARQALDRWLTVSWSVTARYRVLFAGTLSADDPGTGHDRHRPVVERLTEILRRGRTSGEFADRAPVRWQVAATVALGHAAGEEAATGRMTEREAANAYRDSVLRLVTP